MNAPALIKDIGFNNLRIPYQPELAEAFEVDNVRWKVLQEAIFPNAKSLDSLVMALTYCKTRNLDVFKRPIHIVPMWSSAAGKMIETVWPSISELRTTAFRTGQYAGLEEPEFGPEISEAFEGTPSRGNDRTLKKATVRFPEWCRITVVRILDGRERRFVGPKVLWREAYARVSDTDVPNEMWCKRPVGQLEKCAEAAALRRAFPEEIGNEYTAEEMEGQRLFDGERREEGERSRSPAPGTSRAPAPPTKAEAIEHQPAVTIDAQAIEEKPAEVVAAAVEEPKPEPRRAPPPPPKRAPAPAHVSPAAQDSQPLSPAAATFVDKVQQQFPGATVATAAMHVDDEAILKDWQEAAEVCRDRDTLDECWNDLVMPVQDKILKPTMQECDRIYNVHARRLHGQ